MKQIFNYQTFNVSLDKATRTLYIKLKSENDDNSIKMETLFEFETLLSWLTTRVEIHSVMIQSNTDKFSVGYNQKILPKLTTEKLSKFTKKLQKINQAIMLLPQTVIIDLQHGASNIACELATACDIRIAHRQCEINFDHTKLGIVPCSGGIAQLSKVIGQANARNWLLSALPVRANKLETSGYALSLYSTEMRGEVIQELLKSIHAQAPVQRIQTKLGVVENIREDINNMTEFENQIAKASMITEDWKEENQGDNMPAKNMGQAVKLTLVEDKPTKTPELH